MINESDERRVSSRGGAIKTEHREFKKSEFCSENEKEFEKTSRISLFKRSLLRE